MEHEQLVTDNMNLVHFVINKHYPTFRFDEDLIQCGMIGLVKAAQSFNDSKGEFSTYASFCIINEIKREFSIRLRGKENVIFTELEQTHTMVDGEDQYGDVELVESFSRFYHNLTVREQTVVKLRLEGRSNENIGKVIGKSRSTTEKILKKLRCDWEKSQRRSKGEITN